MNKRYQDNLKKHQSKSKISDALKDHAPEEDSLEVGLLQKISVCECILRKKGNNSFRSTFHHRTRIVQERTDTLDAASESDNEGPPWITKRGTIPASDFFS